MAAAPQPPTPGRGLFADSEPLKTYHGLLSPFFDQVRDAFSGLALADNFGGLVTEPMQVTASAGGVLTNVSVSCPFAPLLVLYRAEALDSKGRGTGTMASGGVSWTASAQGLQVTKAHGLDAGTYAVVFIALPG